MRLCIRCDRAEDLYRLWGVPLCGSCFDAMWADALAKVIDRLTQEAIRGQPVSVQPRGVLAWTPEPDLLESIASVKLMENCAMPTIDDLYRAIAEECPRRLSFEVHRYQDYVHGTSTLHPTMICLPRHLLRDQPPPGWQVTEVCRQAEEAIRTSRSEDVRS